MSIHFAKWITLCPLNILSFYIPYLFWELTYYTVFLPIFYFICK